MKRISLEAVLHLMHMRGLLRSKSRQKVWNWKQYSQALVKLDSLTLWLDEQATKQFTMVTGNGVFTTATALLSPH